MGGGSSVGVKRDKINAHQVGLVVVAHKSSNDGSARRRDDAHPLCREKEKALVSLGNSK